MDFDDLGGEEGDFVNLAKLIDRATQEELAQHPKYRTIVDDLVYTSWSFCEVFIHFFHSSFFIFIFFHFSIIISSHLTRTLSLSSLYEKQPQLFVRRLIQRYFGPTQGHHPKRHYVQYKKSQDFIQSRILFILRRWLPLLTAIELETPWQSEESTTSGILLFLHYLSYFFLYLFILIHKT